MEKKIPVSQFDLSAFIQAVTSYLQKRVAEGMDPLAAIPAVENGGRIPGWAEEQPGRNLLDELTKQGKMLFFPFSESNVGLPIFCADGQHYEFEEPDEADEEVPDLTDADWEEVEAEECMGETDAVGYMISLDETQKNLHIRSGMLYGGGCMCPPSAEAVEKIPSIFVEPMEAFISKFQII